MNKYVHMGTVSGIFIVTGTKIHHCNMEAIQKHIDGFGKYTGQTTTAHILKQQGQPYERTH